MCVFLLQLLIARDKKCNMYAVNSFLFFCFVFFFCCCFVVVVVVVVFSYFSMKTHIVGTH